VRKMFPVVSSRIPWVLTSALREALIVLVGGSLLSQLLLGLRGQTHALFQGQAFSGAAVSSVPVEAVHFRLDASEPSTLSQIDFRVPGGLEEVRAGARLVAQVGDGARLSCWDIDGDAVWSCPASGVPVSEVQRLRVELE